MPELAAEQPGERNDSKLLEKEAIFYRVRLLNVERIVKTENPLDHDDR